MLPQRVIDLRHGSRACTARARRRRSRRYSANGSTCLKYHAKRVIYSVRGRESFRDIRLKHNHIGALFENSPVILSTDGLRVVEVVLGSHVVGLHSFRFHDFYALWR